MKKFLTIRVVGFTMGMLSVALFPTKPKEIKVSDNICNKYKIDSIYYKTNFEKCIDNNVAESYRNK